MISRKAVQGNARKKTKTLPQYIHQALFLTQQHATNSLELKRWFFRARSLILFFNWDFKHMEKISWNTRERKIEIWEHLRLVWLNCVAATTNKKKCYNYISNDKQWRRYQKWHDHWQQISPITLTALKIII